MSIKSNIRKLLFLALTVVLSGALLVLLIAAISKKNHSYCKGVAVKITGIGNYYFLGRKDVMNIIAPGTENALLRKPLASFDLNRMESLLEHNVWVKDAELFFDNNDILRVNVEEREPIARIFASNGNSFYIDSSGKHLPLNDKMVVKLPVFTNFPTDIPFLHGSDSLLMEQVKAISQYILKDSFWNAQLAQLDINAEKKFEIIPVVGNHVILFGNGEDIIQKFHRLMLFYQQVSSKVGMDKYSFINVQYDKQVTATRKVAAGKIDSLQVLKNIQKLIEASHQLQNDTVSTMVDNNIVVNNKPDSSLTVLTDESHHTARKNSLNAVPTATNLRSMKSHPSVPLSYAPEKKPVTTKKQVPRAVMKKPG